MRSSTHIIVALLFLLVAHGAGLACGGENDDRESDFPDLQGGDLSVEAIDWAVDGMRCNGDEIARLVRFVDREAGGDIERSAEYARGDGCVDAGDQFWTTIPTQLGDEVEINFESDVDDKRSFTVDDAGESHLVLVADDGAEVVMQRVYRYLNPSPIPDLVDFDLAGQWWMEGYPCHEELVPQLVQVIHPPGAVHMTKIVGDECIGDGEAFFDGEVSGTSVSGEAWLEEQSDIPHENEPVLEANGTVRTEHYMRLDADGQAVTLRRVLDSSSH